MKVIYSGLQNPSRVYVYNNENEILFIRIKEGQRHLGPGRLVAIFKITYHAKR